MPILMADLLREAVKKITNRKLQLEQDSDPRGPKPPRTPEQQAKFDAFQKEKQTTVTEPAKKKRGRPTKADVAAREAEKLSTQRTKAQSTLPDSIRKDLEAARQRRAQSDDTASVLAAAKAELDAAMSKEKTSRKQVAGKKVTINPLPTTDTELPGYAPSRARSTDYNPDDQEFDVDSALRGGRRPLGLDETSHKKKKGSK
jgi:hypothetical protein